MAGVLDHSQVGGGVMLSACWTPQWWVVRRWGGMLDPVSVVSVEAVGGHAGPLSGGW